MHSTYTVMCQYIIVIYQYILSTYQHILKLMVFPTGENCSSYELLDTNLLKPSRIEFVTNLPPYWLCQIHKHPRHSGWSTSTGLHILSYVGCPPSWPSE
jgi:hypothetical protein